MGEPKPTDFRLESAPVPEPGPGQVLLRTLWLSLDPYMRGRMSDAKSYAKPVGIGEVMTGGTVGEVVRSNAPGIRARRHRRSAWRGWQEYAVVDGTELRKVDPAAAPISTALGVLGMPGMTAYIGLLEIGQPKSRRDRRRRRGAGRGRLRSSARSPRSRAAAPSASPAAPTSAATSSRSSASTPASTTARRTSPEQLKAACPKGIDVYFENVGGAVWDAVFPLLNDFARVPVCGLIAHYNMTELPPGPRPHGRDLPRRPDEAPHHPRLHRLGLPGAGAGVPRPRSANGCARAGSSTARTSSRASTTRPQAFIGLLKGKNFGKLVVRVAK